jgi:hypothetical protein
MKQACHKSRLSMTPIKQRAFDHVGIHHWLILPAVSPEISGGHAKAVSAVWPEKRGADLSPRPLAVIA